MTISRHEDVDRQRLAKRIGATGILALRQRASAFTSRAPDASGFYIAILDSYNHKLRESHRLSPVFRSIQTEDEE